MTSSVVASVNTYIVFGPTSGSQTLGKLGGTVIYRLAGSAPGNSFTGTASATDGASKIDVSSGASWTLTGVASAYEHFINGTLIIGPGGTMRAVNRATNRRSGGTLHYNNPGAVQDARAAFVSNENFDFDGGSVDQTSGAPITTSTHNPDMTWDANWTVIGGTAHIATGFNGKLQTNGNHLELVVTADGAGSPYETWAGSGVAFDADANNDGVDNGMAWLLGAANPAENALNKLPAATRNGANLRLTFRCLKSTKRGGAVLKVQSSSDLGLADPWTHHEAAVPDEDATVNGVVFDTTEDGDYFHVLADIPAPKSGLFARLSAVNAP